MSLELITKYHPNGQKHFEGYYDDTDPVGDHTSWYENGNIEHEFLEISESIEMSTYWYDNGQIKCLTFLKDGKYHKKKGVVEKVKDHFIGEVRMLDSKHVLRLDQQMLETVIPKEGGRVRLLQGSHRGKDGSVRRINADRFSVSVQVEGGGDAEVEVPYEDVSKIR